MARFFFDITDESGFHRDMVGEVFIGFEEARQQCQALLPDIVREELPDGDLHSVVCDIRNEEDKVIYRGEVTYRGTYFTN